RIVVARRQAGEQGGVGEQRDGAVRRERVVEGVVVDRDQLQLPGPIDAEQAQSRVQRRADAAGERIDDQGVLAWPGDREVVQVHIGRRVGEEGIAAGRVIGGGRGGRSGEAEPGLDRQGWRGGEGARGG